MQSDGMTIVLLHELFDRQHMGAILKPESFGQPDLLVKRRLNAMAVLEVGCRRLRESSPSPSAFELRWHTLAVDLLNRSTGAATVRLKPHISTGTSTTITSNMCGSEIIPIPGLSWPWPGTSMRSSMSGV